MDIQEFERGADLNLPPEQVFDFLKDVKLMMDLTPFFEVKAVEKLTEGPLSEGSRYKLDLVDDVTEQDASDEITIEEYEERHRIAWAFEKEERRVIFEVRPRGRGSRLMVKEIYHLPGGVTSGYIDRLSRDHLLWIRSIAQYLRLYEKNTFYHRMMRWVMNKIWLPMTPSQRRIALLILLIQGVVLLAFVFGALMLYLKGIIEGLL
ncbi:MAG: SRPBCC family protein [Peptococcaceae bacterium]|nr:SRPBCC family protein [Peptococcaceae bacterium]